MNVPVYEWNQLSSKLDSNDSVLIAIANRTASFEIKNQIEFGNLPKTFVLKCNHGSRYNIVVKDKLDYTAAEIQINKWLHENFAYRCGCEMQYDMIPHKVYAEQYIEQMDGNLLDYKFHCFNGEPRYI